MLNFLDYYEKHLVLNKISEEMEVKKLQCRLWITEELNFRFLPYNWSLFLFYIYRLDNVRLYFGPQTKLYMNQLEQISKMKTFNSIHIDGYNITDSQGLPIPIEEIFPMFYYVERFSL